MNGGYSKIIETYGRLIELKKKYKKLNVNIAVTISALNQEYLPEIFKLLSEELKVNNIRGLLLRGNPKNLHAAENLDINKYYNFHKLIERGFYNNKKSGFSGFFLTDFLNAKDMISYRKISEIYKNKKCIMPCYAGKIAGVIMNNGSVYPCELLDRKLGELRENNYDFKKIWFSRQAMDIRNDIKKTNCFCTHELFLANNILYNIRNLPGLTSKVLYLNYLKLYYKLKNI